MARLLWFLSVVLAAVILGTASAIFVVQTLRPTGMLKLGPWEAVQAVGDASANPYTHALIASSGQLPPGSAEGMRFVAVEATDGSALRPDCSITLSGQVSLARLWTLSLVTPAGRPLELAGARGMHAQDIVYHQDGSFDLTIGPRPQATNTLLQGGMAPLGLVLHLYDGAITSLPEEGAQALPAITVGTEGPGCGS
jgi:hypothetical protein